MIVAVIELAACTDGGYYAIEITEPTCGVNTQFRHPPNGSWVAGGEDAM
jgi:rRNA maturation protein Nop10